MFRVAAIALVEPNDVHATRKCLRGDTLHVVRLTGPIEPVQRENRWPIPRVRMPVTLREHARARGNVEVAGNGSRQRREVAWIAPAVQSHPVTAAERTPRNKLVHPFDHTRYHY